MASSIPGIGGSDGRAPVAISTLSTANALVAVGELHRVRVLQLGPGVDEVGAGVLQVGDVDAREPGDLDVLGLEEAGPVERRPDFRPAEALGGLERRRELAGVDHELLRHAAADHAGAADPVLLGDPDAGARHRRHPRRPHAARAGADDEEVVVEPGHASSSGRRHMARKRGAAKLGRLSNSPRSAHTFAEERAGGRADAALAFHRHHALVGADQRALGEAEEEAVLDDAGDALQRRLDAGRIEDGAAGRVVE